MMITPVTIKEWDEIEVEADRRMRLTNGHLFTAINLRCKHCNRKPENQHTSQCQLWFQTYRWHLRMVLQEKKIIV